MEKNSNELKHYGVLGMRWGVIHEQNETAKPNTKNRFIIEKRTTRDIYVRGKKVASKGERVPNSSGPFGIKTTLKRNPNYSKKRLSDLDKKRIKKGMLIAGGILAAIGSVAAFDYGLKKSTGGAGLAFAKDMLIATAHIKAKGSL